MEEMLLRVCVVVVSLLYIKDHTVVQEQEKSVIMDMQEREYLLQEEAAKLDQEVHQVTTGLPHSNQEVSQRHRRLTNGAGQDSDVQQVENLHEHQMPPGEDLDVLQQNLLIKDEADPLTQHGFIVDENVPSDKGVMPENVRSSKNEINNVQEDDMSGHKKEAPDNDQKMKTLNEDQIKEVQGKSPLSDSDQKFPHSDQVGELFIQMQNEDDPHMPVKENTAEFTQEKPTASSQQTENSYNWNLLKFLSVISLIRFLRKFISKDSQSPATIIPIKDKTRDTGILSKISLLDHQELSCFYDQCVQIPLNTCSQVSTFVEGFVDELLEAAREASNEESDMRIGNFIGVGSVYELWATGKTMVCDLYVPITAPRSHGFDVELQEEKDASLPSFGKIKVVKAENTSNGCPCMDGKSDDDFLCLLHSPSETYKVMMNAIGGPLCQENTPYLSKKQIVKWFRTMIIKAWGEISHNYEFELTFRSQKAPGAMRVRFRSGQIILFNITPVVQVKASQVYLVSYLTTNQNLSDVYWPISLASYEKELLQNFSKTLPYKSCHTECLQILSFLHKEQQNLTGKCGLTNYHLKSTLLHLLMDRQTEWKHAQLTDRLKDMLTFLKQRLQAKELHHALIGNPLVPKDIGLPEELQIAKPTNIFLPLALDEECYLRTVHHFQELVKNAPILIQEYGSLKTLGLQST